MISTCLAMLKTLPMCDKWTDTSVVCISLSVNVMLRSYHLKVCCEIFFFHFWRYFSNLLSHCLPVPRYSTIMMMISWCDSQYTSMHCCCSTAYRATVSQIAPVWNTAPRFTSRSLGARSLTIITQSSYDTIRQKSLTWTPKLNLAHVARNWNKQSQCPFNSVQVKIRGGSPEGKTVTMEERICERDEF